MSAYDDAPEHIQRATDDMLDHLLLNGLDMAKVAALQTEMTLSQHQLLFVEIGVKAGIAAVFEFMQKHDLLRRDDQPPPTP